VKPDVARPFLRLSTLIEGPAVSSGSAAAEGANALDFLYDQLYSVRSDSGARLTCLGSDLSRA
jgi:hypothetical protein